MPDEGHVGLDYVDVGVKLHGVQLIAVLHTQSK